MDDNCGEWVECMGVASGCGEQEVGVASGSGWNLWVWLLGLVVRRYIDFLILLIPTPLVSVLFCSSIPTFCSFKKNHLLVNWRDGKDFGAILMIHKQFLLIWFRHLGHVMLNLIEIFTSSY